MDPLYQEALQQAVNEAMAEMRPQLEEIDVTNKKILEEAGMTIIEYDEDFFKTIMEMDGVKALYEKINADTNGLAAILQEELAK